MKENLDMSKDQIIAEPLYILVAIRGFPNAYTHVKGLVDKSRKEGKPLMDLIWNDQQIAPILKTLSPEQSNILKNPIEYRGAAYQRTKAICDEWSLVLRQEELGKTQDPNLQQMHI